MKQHILTEVTMTKDYVERWDKVRNGSLCKGDTVLVSDQINGGAVCVHVQKKGTHVSMTGYGRASTFLEEYCN